MRLCHAYQNSGVLITESVTSLFTWFQTLYPSTYCTPPIFFLLGLRFYQVPLQFLISYSKFKVHFFFKGRGLYLQAQGSPG